MGKKTFTDILKYNLPVPTENTIFLCLPKYSLTKTDEINFWLFINVANVGLVHC